MSKSRNRKAAGKVQVKRSNDKRVEVSEEKLSILKPTREARAAMPRPRAVVFKDGKHDKKTSRRKARVQAAEALYQANSKKEDYQYD